MPERARGKFLPQAATKLGCKPKDHFRFLTAGETITLDDGTVVTPEQVSDKQIAANACELIFLTDESYVESFVNDNVRFHQLLQQVDLERPYNTGMIYHAV